jgi:hypothetical protein
VRRTDAFGNHHISNDHSTWAEVDDGQHHKALRWTPKMATVIRMIRRVKDERNDHGRLAIRPLELLCANGTNQVIQAAQEFG